MHLVGTGRLDWHLNNVQAMFGVSETMTPDRDKAERFNRYLVLHLTGRCLFLTSTGMLGLRPAKAKIDDVVCVMFGCELPLILRKNWTTSCL